jgi:hypothetical protein
VQKGSVTGVEIYDKNLGAKLKENGDRRKQMMQTPLDKEVENICYSQPVSNHQHAV